MAKKPPSAYFLFCEQERADARQSCFEADPAAKVSVAVVAKELGKRWEALCAEEKQAFKDEAKERALKFQADAEEQRGSAQGLPFPAIYVVQDCSGLL